MLAAVRKLLGIEDQLTRLAEKPDAARFAIALCKSPIRILAAMEHPGIDPSQITEAKLIEMLRGAAASLSQDKDFLPFVYTDHGRRKLPFFSTPDRVESFIGEYSKRQNRVFPFQVLGVQGSVLARVCPACDVLVLNPYSAKSIELSTTQTTALVAASEFYQ